MSCTDKMYLTGNEICSDNPRDLSDNARVFDAYVNSAEFSVTDRFGVERVTLAWAKWRVDNAIDEATGEIRAEWQTGVANINSEETSALSNISTLRDSSLASIGSTTTASLTSIEEAKDNAIEEIIEAGGVDLAQEPGQDINKVMSQKAVTDFVTEEIDSIVIPEPVNVVNETGQSTVDAISQKAFTEMSFGIGQEWVDVKSERAVGSEYINESNSTIFVSIDTSNSGQTGNGLYVENNDGEYTHVGSAEYAIQAPIPPHKKYKVVRGGVQFWVELR